MATKQPPKTVSTARSGRWSHALCGCLDNIPLCVIGVTSPCVLVAEVAGELGESRCTFCVASLIPGVNLMQLARLRGLVRKTQGIPGEHLDDMCAVCCCPFCALVQTAQESMEMRDERMAHAHGGKRRRPDGKWRINGRANPDIVVTLAPSPGGVSRDYNAQTYTAADDRDVNINMGDYNVRKMSDEVFSVRF